MVRSRASHRAEGAGIVAKPELVELIKGVIETSSQQRPARLAEKIAEAVESVDKCRRKKTLAIDFDGVIHRYSSGWQDGSVYDPPVPGAIDELHVLAGRYRLVVFTARDELGPVRDALALWGLLDGTIDEVTNQKPKAWAYLDDRAVRFSDWDTAVTELARLAETDGWTP